MTADAFLDSFTDSIYCDLQARPKTAKALIKLSDRIPESVENDLPRIVVFAPNPRDYGLCIPLMAGDPDGADAFIYLAPSLERHSQTEVDFTVAHEFAHALLRHHEPENLMTFSMDEATKGYLNWNSELAADELVAEWGYKIPKRRSRKV
jgi:IrrE N-terminal-like domain